MPEADEHVASQMPTTRRPRLLGPPGWLFYAVIAASVVLAVWVSSLGDFILLIGAMYLGIALAAVWGLRLIGAAVSARLRFSSAEWIRWIAVPLVLGVTSFWILADGPFHLRFSLSKTAMDQTAAAVIAGGRTDAGWIGLWPVEQVERRPDGMRFIVSGCGLIDRCGFAYTIDGRQPETLPSDEDASYEPVDDHWFVWVDRF